MPPCFLPPEVKLILIGLKCPVGIELLEQFFHAIEVLPQGDFGVGVTAMVKNAEGPLVSGLADDL